MSTVELDDAPVGEQEPFSPPPATEEQWRRDRRGREYVPRGAGHGSGQVWRQGDETVAEARARDVSPGDRRPRRKVKTPKMPEAPRKADLKQLEQTLAEALKAPAMLAASFGDEFGAEHFNRAGPYLARNLILASEHNPWLRQKLEEAATGQDAMMMVVSLVGVGGALFMYVVPPIIYYFNLPAPAKTREMFGIPDRKERPPDYAASPPPGGVAYPAAA
jgi:hypothetical protein